MNVAHELWEIGGTPIGQGLREAVDDGVLKLAVGGSELHGELEESSTRLQEWVRELGRAGYLTELEDHDVDREERNLRAGLIVGANEIRSDDQHIVALARVSHARLLFSRDRKLRLDFKNRLLIARPAGKILNSEQDTELTPARKRMLANPNLCKTS